MIAHKLADALGAEADSPQNAEMSLQLDTQVAVHHMAGTAENLVGVLGRSGGVLSPLRSG